MTTLRCLRWCGLVVLAVCTFYSQPAAAAPVITEFPLPTANSVPDSIVFLGADGNFWFVERNAGKIGRMSPNGMVDEFGLTVEGQYPVSLTIGPDDALWFTGSHYTDFFVGRMTQTGSVTNTWQPASGIPGDITTGPDGNLWFIAGTDIGRATPDGDFPEPFAVVGGVPLAITRNPAILADNLWFTARSPSRIGRITTEGAVTWFSGLTPDSDPPDIVHGPDGNFWFTERYADKIGRITTGGVVTEFGGLTAGSRPYGITRGWDGNLWFTENDGNRIGRITPSGTVTEFTGLTAGSKPTSITAGPANTLWFTESVGNRIGRVTIPACDVPTMIPAAGGVFSGSTLGDSTLGGTYGAAGPEKVFQWTPDRAGTALIETCGNGTNIDTALYLRGGGCEGGTELASSDDACLNSLGQNRASRLTPFVGEGQTYYIIVDSFTAGNFRLTVVPPGVGCEAPIVVPGSGGTFFGTLVGASGLQGSCGGPGPERVFQWTPDHSGSAMIETCGNGTDFDSVLYVRHTNCNRGAEVTCSDDQCANATGLTRASSINMAVTAGETYFVFVDSYGAGGSYTLTINGPAPCDDVETIPAAGGVFSGHTQGANTLIGSCGGNGPEKIYRWTPETSGTAVIDTCAGATYETLLYVRQGDCLNGAQLGCNQVAFCQPGLFASRVYPDVVAGETYYIIVDGVGGQSGNFTLTVQAPVVNPPTPTVSPTPTATPTMAPSPTTTAGDSACDRPTTLRASGGRLEGTTSGADTLTGSCGSSNGPEKVFQWTPAVSGIATIETCGEGTRFDTTLYVRGGSCAGADLACSDDACPNHYGSALASKITLAVTAGETYFIVVDGALGESGPFALEVTPPQPATPTATAIATATNSSAPTLTATIPPTATCTPSGTALPTSTATRTPTVLPSTTVTAPSTPTFSASPPRTPTRTPPATASVTSTGTPSPNATGTLSVVPTPSQTGVPSQTPTPEGSATVAASPTTTRTGGPPCTGDCNGSGEVTIPELITLVNIALGNAPLADCMAGDHDSSGTVTVDELVAAVKRALEGCAS
jgi:streptogramin lyase